MIADDGADVVPLIDRLRRIVTRDRDSVREWQRAAAALRRVTTYPPHWD